MIDGNFGNVSTSVFFPKSRINKNGGNLKAKKMTSRQKEKHYDKRKRLTTKRITTTSWQKKKELKTLKCPLGIKEILP